MPGSRCQPANGWFVLVAGWPGSAKSTLAAALASELGLPLPTKDEIKEALMEGLGRPGTAAAPQRLGRAASRPMPATGSGRDAAPGPAPGDRPAPPSRAAGRGM
jgi:hypothetical protein